MYIMNKKKGIKLNKIYRIKKSNGNHLKNTGINARMKTSNKELPGESGARTIQQKCC